MHLWSSVVVLALSTVLAGLSCSVSLFVYRVGHGGDGAFVDSVLAAVRMGDFPGARERIGRISRRAVARALAAGLSTSTHRDLEAIRDRMRHELANVERELWRSRDGLVALLLATMVVGILSVVRVQIPQAPLEGGFVWVSVAASAISFVIGALGLVWVRSALSVVEGVQRGDLARRLTMDWNAFAGPPSARRRGVFVSYMTADATWAAISLYVALRTALPAMEVFVDRFSLVAGDKFSSTIERFIRQCAVFVVIVSPRWNSGLLEDDDAWVRREIEMALRADALVIPVLLDDMEMPSTQGLPSSLQVLFERQCMRIRSGEFGRDVDKLVNVVGAARPASSFGV